MYSLKKLFNPELYQGKYKYSKYFEGWYFKLVDEKQNNILSIIPGISRSNSKDSHAFIQIIDGNGYTNYLNYSLKDFHYSLNDFEIKIENNYFTNNQIVLDIIRDEIKIVGSLNFINIIPYPKKLLNPGIMGVYSFVPFMECYHGIVNIHHEILGQLQINSSVKDFTGGYGYIEKDWGKSFPDSWIWLQSNHFNEPRISFMFSIARIPWFSSSFLGFISFIRINDKQYTFASYTKAKVKKLSYENNILSILIQDKKYSLYIKVHISNTKGDLIAPMMGCMNRTIQESINSIVEVKLLKFDKEDIFNGVGYHTGTEFAGDICQFNIAT
ncbi:MAG: tocopherol cyclase family protein [Eubacteriaceae bacterium]